jgi:hypothetical protein
MLKALLTRFSSPFKVLVIPLLIWKAPPPYFKLGKPVKIGIRIMNHNSTKGSAQRVRVGQL